MLSLVAVVKGDVLCRIFKTCTKIVLFSSLFGYFRLPVVVNSIFNLKVPTLPSTNSTTPKHQPYHQPTLEPQSTNPNCHQPTPKHQPGHQPTLQPKSTNPTTNQLWNPKAPTLPPTLEPKSINPTYRQPSVPVSQLGLAERR